MNVEPAAATDICMWSGRWFPGIDESGWQIAGSLPG